jgi:tRNA A-37 threonylcarbamoyl transferase component Bud32
MQLSRDYAAAIDEVCGAEPGWRVEQWPSHRAIWCTARHARHRLPAQGWKLHLSATITTAETVIERVLPVLLAERCAFKVAANHRVLVNLNAGFGGLSQAGKFMAVYPATNEDAVRIAYELDRATADLRGPRIWSDRRLSPSSLVHYRYGAFGGDWRETASGATEPMLRFADGSERPDVHVPAYLAPTDVRDPFTDEAHELEAIKMLAGRYLMFCKLTSSPRGSVHLGADLQTYRRCVIKRAHRDAMIDAEGKDACDRLRREAVVLRALEGHDVSPHVVDLVEDDDTYLVLDDLNGTTLSAKLEEHARSASLPRDIDVIERARAIARTVAKLHALGWTHRDLKPGNVILNNDGTCRLIDFELAHHAQLAPDAAMGGTRGYMSPAQRAGSRPSTADDIHAFGALLYAVATATEPALAPEPHALGSRSVCDLNPRLSPHIATIIDACLADRAEERPASIDEVARALVTARHPPAARSAPSHDLGELASALCTSLVGDWSEWQLRLDHGGFSNLARGVSGYVIALAEAATVFGRAAYEPVLVAACDRLVAAARLDPGEGHCGLYSGDAGIARAVLRAGDVLGAPELRDHALSIGRRIAGVPHRSPDMFAGSAGRLVLHRELWCATGAVDQLEAATRAGHALCDSALIDESGAAWLLPAERGEQGARCYLGHAFGGAGICEALLDLYRTTSTARFRDIARLGLQRVARAAQRSRDGLVWPAFDDGPLSGTSWSEGSAGLARAFLRAHELGVLPDARALAEGASLAVAYGGRGSNESWAHGLAGNIGALIDVGVTTDNEMFLEHARIHGQLLAAYVVLDPATRWYEFGRCQQGLFGGQEGVAMALLALAGGGRNG